MRLDAEEELRRAVVYEIQNFSTDAGPGIRVAVFFKGCPSACRWCEHPEGISYRPELSLLPIRCIQCGDCVETCPNGALRFEGGTLQIVRRRCNACGICLSACPSGALEIIGRSYTLPALLDQIKQSSVFQSQGGGVTFSGGEAASQRSFLRALASACKSEGIHTCLDTCLIHEWGVYRELVPHIDLWRVNLTHVTKAAPGNGQGALTPLDNLTALTATGAHIWVRTPVVPGWSDTVEDIRTIAAFVSQQWPAVERWELQAYASPGATRFCSQGQVLEYQELDPVPASTLNTLADEARRICDRRIPVITSGPTAMD